jgi:hypothetical protein
MFEPNWLTSNYLQPVVLRFSAQFVPSIVGTFLPMKTWADMNKSSEYLQNIYVIFKAIKTFIEQIIFYFLQKKYLNFQFVFSVTPLGFFLTQRLTELINAHVLFCV